MHKETMKLWGKALNSQLLVDTNTFLITSILPLGYVEQATKDGEPDKMIVDVADIKKLTTYAEEGIERLVKCGWALFHDGRKSIVIGSSKNFINTTYFFTGGQQQRGPVKSAGETIADDPDMTATLEALDKMHDTYTKFCSKMALQQNADKVFTKVNSTLKAAYAGKFTPTGLLSYLSGVNAMVNDWVAIPATYTGKELGLAKGIIEKIDTKRLIQLVPFYVTEYPRNARKGYEETNILNLHYNITTLLTQYGKKHKTKTHGKDDTL